MERILFVCTGNTCRSPLAQALLKEKRPDFEVKSAGVNALPGMNASEGTIQVLAKKGIKLNHVSSQVNIELVGWADIILALTEGHKQQLIKNFPGFENKIYTLKEAAFKEEVENSEQKISSFSISDPFGGSIEVYEKTANEIETTIDKFLKKL
ncbi:low molecular weight protein arginine phosphatase [Bacillaceae bacterium IKA-2]|jgi:protein-tyrosine-phosphatase|nr:low molecular weight protein arginine phosphatase [Bacillaceae bacterium IKA-2]